MMFEKQKKWSIKLRILRVSSGEEERAPHTGWKRRGWDSRAGTCLGGQVNTTELSSCLTLSWLCLALVTASVLQFLIFCSSYVFTLT